MLPFNLSGKLPRFVSLVVFLLSASAPQLNAAAPCELARLVPSDTNVGEEFGVSVSLSGDVLVVGDSADDQRATDAGAAYVFRRTPQGWRQEAKLVPADAAAGDGFGGSVSISAERIIVGSCGNDEAAQDAGAAYVFRFNGASWPVEAKIKATDATAQALFGCTVAISGDRVAVGAFNIGAAYVFRRTGTTWTQEGKLTGSDVVPGMAFAQAVAISGDAVLVGVLGGAVNGAAYVFRLTGVSWAQETKLTASDGVPEDFFGWSAALSGDLATVGAPFFKLPPPPRMSAVTNEPGAAYVFRRSGGVWGQEAKLTANDIEENARIGIGVALQDDLAVIGADHGCCITPGAAYLFRRVSGAWQQNAILTPSDSTPVDLFGSAVAVDGNYIAVGAYGDESDCIGEPDCPTLRAYVFSAPCVLGIPALSPLGTVTLAFVLFVAGVAVLRRSATKRK